MRFCLKRKRGRNTLLRFGEMESVPTVRQQSWRMCRVEDELSKWYGEPWVCIANSGLFLCFLWDVNPSRFGSDGFKDFLEDPAVFECLVSRISLAVDIGDKFSGELSPAANGGMFDVGQVAGDFTG